MEYSLDVGNLSGSVSRAAGGLQHSVRRLVLETQRLGLRVSVFSLRDRYTDVDLPLWEDAPVTTFPVLGPTAFGFAPGLAKSMQQAKIDLLHVHGIWMYPSVAALIATQRRRMPYIISTHGMLDPWALKNSHWKKAIAGWFYEGRHLRGAVCLRALCESEARSMRACGLRNPICVIPNGQDVLIEEAESSSSWGAKLPPDCRTLLFLGRLHPKKGLAKLLEAWATARKRSRRYQEWTLVIAGWDQSGHEAQLKRIATDLGVGDSVVFPGPLFGEEKGAALRRASAFVLPSLSEGLPMAVLEAWAYRLPVLMTPQCNLPEGFTACAALPMEPETGSIGAALESLFEMTDSDRRDMGNRGHDLVASKFSWADAGARMIEVYQWAVGGGSQPDCVLRG